MQTGTSRFNKAMSYCAVPAVYASAPRYQSCVFYAAATVRSSHASHTRRISSHQAVRLTVPCDMRSRRAKQFMQHISPLCSIPMRLMSRYNMRCKHAVRENSSKCLAGLRNLSPAYLQFMRLSRHVVQKCFQQCDTGLMTHVPQRACGS